MVRGDQVGAAEAIRRAQQEGLLPSHPSSIPQRNSQDLSLIEDVDGVCQQCLDTGYLREDVPFGHPKFGVYEPCACRMEEVNARKAKRSRLTPEMQTFTLDGFRAREGLLDVTPVLRDALDRASGWVTLSGPFGVGKTFLLAATVNEARLAGKLAIYTTIADLLDDLRSSFDPKSGENFGTIFHDFATADVLAIDEIEKFRATAWAEEKFFQLIEQRYRAWADCLTVLATNRRLNQEIVAETRYPGYLESRIKDGRFWQLDQFWQVKDVRPALRRKKRVVKRA